MPGTSNSIGILGEATAAGLCLPILKNCRQIFYFQQTELKYREIYIVRGLITSSNHLRIIREDGTKQQSVLRYETMDKLFLKKHEYRFFT